MTDFKVGEWYQTRDGRNAYIYDIELCQADDLKKIAGKVVNGDGQHMLVSWYPDGKTCLGGEADIDLVLGKSCWVNVYSDWVSSSHISRQKADAGVSPQLNRLAVLKITVIDKKIYTEIEKCEPHTK